MADHTSVDMNILQAAAEEFADKGFGGARVDEVARRAGVNKATLYYRIGDKAALYGAVLDHVLGETAERVVSDTRLADDPVAKLNAYIFAIARSGAEMPYFAPIMMREVAGGGRNMPDAPLQHMVCILGTLSEILKQGSELGVFRHVNPMATHMLVIGSLAFYAAGGPIRARVAAQGVENFTSQTFPSGDEIAEHVADLVLASLTCGRNG